MKNKEELESVLNDFDVLLQKNVETELYCDRMTLQSFGSGRNKSKKSIRDSIISQTKLGNK